MSTNLQWIVIQRFFLLKPELSKKLLSNTAFTWLLHEVNFVNIHTVATSLSAYCDKEYVIPTTKEAMVTSGREASILSKLACNKKKLLLAMQKPICTNEAIFLGRNVLGFTKQKNFGFHFILARRVRVQNGKGIF